MRTLKQMYYLLALMLLLAAGVILRLFGWRPDGETGIQSLFQNEPKGFAIVSGEYSKAELYPYVYINEDGSARELHENEREYLETPFIGADGGRPYVKWRYKAKNGWGDLSGFLKRTKLPKRIQVGPAPVEDPNRASREETIQRLRSRGYEVIEGSKGGFRVKLGQ